MNSEAICGSMKKSSDSKIIEIEGLHKWFGDFHVLQDINLTVFKGERIVICGPSGSGKSTLIRCINRLEEHQKGKIVVDGIELTGNLKFDVAVPQSAIDLGKNLRQRFGAARPVFLAASTREGEEVLIMEAMSRIDIPDLLIVIVPRHPQRFDEVARLATQRGFAVQRRSDSLPIAASTQVLIGDSMGEMFAWYASADAAFIGGSLLDFGSQNLIEAAACGTPILIGPSTRNFADAAREAIACGAALPITDADDLVSQVTVLLSNGDARQRMGMVGRAFAERHRGATARTLELISRAGR